MAKEKLFTPEDFDKPSDSKGALWKKYLNELFKNKYLLGIVLVVLGLAAWGIASYNASDEETPVKEDLPQTEEVVTQPTDSIDTDSVTEVAVEEPAVETVEEKQEPAVVKEPQNTQPVSNDVEKEALNVIRGDYGNNPQRRQRLGASYQSIQNRVNQMKKEGVF